MNRSLKSYAAILLVLTLHGCQTLSHGGLIVSSASADLSQDAIVSIVDDMVGELDKHLAKGTTTLRLGQDGSTFGIALADRLRTSGYAILEGKDAAMEIVELAYVVSSLDGGVLVRLSTLTFDLTRLYRIDGGSAVPSSPLSVLARDAVDRNG